MIELFEGEGIFQSLAFPCGDEIWVSLDVDKQSLRVDGPLAKADFDINVTRIDAGTNPVTVGTSDQIGILVLRYLCAVGKDKSSALTQENSLGIDEKRLRFQANRDLNFARPCGNSRIDGHAGPTWSPRHLPVLNGETRTCLQQFEVARGLEIVEQTTECCQMCIADSSGGRTSC